MIKVFVDSGSSIKQDEKEKYNVEIIPLRFLMGDTEYKDGLDLSIEDFYNLLIDKKLFPKTSLPQLDEIEEKVTKETQQGNDVIILPISSEISGTYNALKTMFQGNSKVYVVDTLSVIGGIRLLVDEINKYRDMPVDFVLKKVNALIPKIRIVAIPETLDYLLKGGRLSKKEWLFGTVLNLKPIIAIIKGKVKVIAKKIGLNNAIKFITSALKDMKCSLEYPIIASFTKEKKNVERLINATEEKFKNQIKVFDNLDPVIASHWGPNAFGYVFVSEEV